MSVLYLSKDLFFTSRVSATARTAGAEFHVVGSTEDLLTRCIKDGCTLVILDLDTPGLDPARIVGALRDSLGESPSILGFGSHVHEARLKAARLAGCDQVLTRGQFDQRMADILRSTPSSEGRAE
jgi:CheY-like chemotaxis protein